METKLSIIVPVYKVEDTLDRCVDSITSQHYDRMEIILVDDGSPDNCPRLCDKWAGKDCRIKVIHKTNGGLSDARNAGLDIACGEYITFVDSDDFLGKDTFIQVMGTMEANRDFDILEYPAYLYYGSPKGKVFNPGCMTYHNTASYWIHGEAYSHTYAWNKIYRRSLFDGVRFPKGKIFEDVYTLPKIMAKAKTIATTDRGLYMYCHNPNGITNTSGANGLQMLLQAHTGIMYSFADIPGFDKYYMQVANIQLSLCELTGCKPILRDVKIKNFRDMPTKTKYKAAAINILGIKTLCKLFRVMKKISVSR
ncbi:MAG: glycosyltransferase [Prevotella sp.]|nr:glycosyltransferase [Prevotella sp.]